MSPYLCMHIYYCAYKVSWTVNKLEILKKKKKKREDVELTMTREIQISTLVGV